VYVLLLVLIDELFEEDISHTVQIIKIISLTVSVNESARRVRKKLTSTQLWFIILRPRPHFTHHIHKKICKTIAFYMF